MNTPFFSEQTKRAFAEFNKALGESFKRKSPVNALLMNNVIYTGNDDADPESAIITFDGDWLEVSSRDSGYCLMMDDKELLQIIAFALDNGLQLPQNEGDNEGDN